VQKVLREGPQVLRRVDRPLPHRIRVDFEHPRRAPEAQALGQAGDDAYDGRDRGTLTMQECAKGLEKRAVAGDAQQLPRGAPSGVAVAAELPPARPARVGPGRGGRDLVGGIARAGGSAGPDGAGGGGGGGGGAGGTAVLTGVARRFAGETRKRW